MYVRQFGYTIVPGQEEKAAGLCTRFAASLRERGLRAHALIGGKLNSTIQLREEYASVEVMRAAQAALECDENYRSAVSAWAAEFYPLVQAAIPAVDLHQLHEQAA